MNKGKNKLKRKKIKRREHGVKLPKEPSGYLSQGKTLNVGTLRSQSFYGKTGFTPLFARTPMTVRDSEEDNVSFVLWGGNAHWTEEMVLSRSAPEP